MNPYFPNLRRQFERNDHCLKNPFDQGIESDPLQNLEARRVWSFAQQFGLAKVEMTMASFRPA